GKRLPEERAEIRQSLRAQRREARGPDVERLPREPGKGDQPEEPERPCRRRDRSRRHLEREQRQPGLAREHLLPAPPAFLPRKAAGSAFGLRGDEDRRRARGKR